MRVASRSKANFWDLQAFRLFRLRKRTYQFLRYSPSTPKTILFIVGCQRSGTTMISHLFRQDMSVVTYNEVSKLSSSDPGEFRLNPLEDVQAQLAVDRAPLVVAKPLVESQNLGALLDLLPGTKAVWMFRHFKDVARSSVKYFKKGNSHADLQPILAMDQGDWRSEHMAPEVAETIKELYSPDLGDLDASALFWFARNSLYFSRGYDHDQRVLTCRYDDLVNNPGPVMRDLYRFVQRPYPGDKIIAGVSAGYQGKGEVGGGSPGIRAVCQDLLDRLEACRRAGGLTT